MKRKVSFLFIWNKIQELGQRSAIHILLKFRYETLFLPHHTFHTTTFSTSFATFSAVVNQWKKIRFKRYDQDFCYAW